MFVGKAGAWPKVQHLKDASLGYAQALPANIRLNWKGLPGTSASAYYKNSQLMAVKSFEILPQVLEVRS